MSNKIKNFEYTGPFANQIEDFISFKRSIGVEANALAETMRRFDRFTIEYEKENDTTILSKELIEKWAIKKSHESMENLAIRVNQVRQLALYMKSKGFGVYIYPYNTFPKQRVYNPHIYTEDELKRFFKVSDNCPVCSFSPTRHLVMPLIFKVLYCCGLRVSEAVALKVKDVDLNKGVLTITNSKNKMQRLIPMTPELTKKCQEYCDIMHSTSTLDKPFFYNRYEKAYTTAAIYTVFREFLFNAGISHGGKGEGPRLHDFRHTFCVHSLKKLVLQNKNIMAYLPVLKTYMGHGHIKSTLYYLRLTVDLYPHITSEIEGTFGNLIPILSENDE